MSVFALDRIGVSLTPCSEKRARKLLAAARARLHRRIPFAIRLVDRDAHDCALQPLRIKLDPGRKPIGCDSSQRTRLDKYGFARGYLMHSKAVRGFQTGDLVRADVPASSKKAGHYVGRFAVWGSDSFNIQTGSDVVQGISHKHCRIIQRSDGYGYSRIATSKGDAGTGHVARAALSLPGRKPEVSRAIG